MPVRAYMNRPLNRSPCRPGFGARAFRIGIVIAGLSSPVVRAQAAWGPLIAEIPPEPLKLALEDLAHQTGLEVFYVPDVVGDRLTRGSAAGLNAPDAASRLLEGTGLKYEFLSPRAVHILRKPMPLDAVPSDALEEIVVIAQAEVVPAPPATTPATSEEQRLIDTAEGELERRIEHEGVGYRDAELERYVRGIAERLLQTDKTDSRPIHIHIARSIRPNIFALSNGSVYVTTALLASLDDESQLAAVLGHELTHYTNHHALRALRTARHRAMAGRAIEILLRAAFGFAAIRTGAPLYTGSTGEPVVLGDGILGIWERATVTGYSTNLEREADHFALHRLVAAGYDPRAASAAYENLAALAPTSAQESQSYVSRTRLAERADSYHAMLRTEFAQVAMQERDAGREPYQVRIARLPLEQVAMLIEAGSLDLAESALAREIAKVDSARAEFLRGEIARSRQPQSDLATEQALLAYERALALPDAPPSAYRWAGMLHRQRGESDAAARYFQAYLERAPGAVDAGLVRVYLEELRAPDSRIRD
jgi:beta-barrel assembly-enhancing protease